MSDHTRIEWTDATWNPVTGCTKVSQGCKNCYAERDWKRLAAPRETPNRYTGRAFTGVRCHEDVLALPLRWKKPRRIFVNSMSDLFHEDVPDGFIDLVFAAMAQAPQHTFQVLTKRPERMLRWLDAGAHLRMTRCFRNFVQYSAPVGPWPLPNVWLGVSVEDQATADERIPLLLQTPAAVRWVSAEPLLGPVDLTHIQWPGKHRVDALRAGAWDMPGWHPGFVNHSDMERLDWVVTGGESGPHARPCHVDWLRDIVRQCRAADVPVHVKQLGAKVDGVPLSQFPELSGWRADATTDEILGPLLCDRKGGDPAEWPEDLRVREWPR
jgi:protein gp37